jgi:putative peptide zinc metalloprotease protein
MHNATPCLRADVAVRPFDAAEGDCRFVVAVDDRHFLVSAAVAAVLEESRQPGTLATLAQRASARLGLNVSPQQVEQLLREQAPGVLFRPAQESHTVSAPLRFRRVIATALTLRPVLQSVAGLFTRRCALALALLLIVVESMVATRALASPAPELHGAQAATAVALTMLGVLVHELGHLAACLKYQAPHGGIGIGLYWCVPVFFAEVHGAWLLARRQRAVVDVGGLYLQSAYVLTLGALYLVSAAPAVLAAIVCTHFLMLHTLNPVMKYDGYWLLSDLTGTHNLHQCVRRVAADAWSVVCLRQRERMPGVRELALLGGFTSAAVGYFAYTLTLLAHALAGSIARSIESWMHLPLAAAGDVARASFHAVGETAFLAMLLFMAGGISLLLARSLGALVRERTNDR